MRLQSLIDSVLKYHVNSGLTVVGNQAPKRSSVVCAVVASRDEIESLCLRIDAGRSERDGRMRRELRMLKLRKMRCNPDPRDGGDAYLQAPIAPHSVAHRANYPSTSTFTYIQIQLPTSVRSSGRNECRMGACFTAWRNVWVTA